MILEQTTLVLISTSIAFIGCLIAAITDFKWGIVPDKLNYALIALGAIMVLMRFELWNALAVYGIAIAVFVLGLLAYLFGQLGGGDVKFFAALTLLLPFYPKEIAALSPLNPMINIPYPFIVSVFFTSAVLAVFFVSLSYLWMFWRDRKQIKNLKQTAMKGALYFFLVTIPLTLLWGSINQLVLVVIIPIALGAFLLPFKNILLEKYISQEKKVKDLDDDDVLAIELMSEETKEKLGLSSRKTFLNIELKSLKEKAREHGIETVPVSENLPKFVPYIFIALVINLLLGDAFLWMLSQSIIS